MTDLNKIPIGDWDEHTDRQAIEELEDMLRTARDRAHWLAVHRRIKLAAHVEHGCDLLRLMTIDIRGRQARKEPT